MLKNSPIILFRTALSTLQLFPPSTQLFSPQYPIIPVIIKILIDIFDHIVLVCQATHSCMDTMDNKQLSLVKLEHK